MASTASSHGVIGGSFSCAGIARIREVEGRSKSSWKHRQSECRITGQEGRDEIMVSLSVSHIKPFALLGDSCLALVVALMAVLFFQRCVVLSFQHLITFCAVARMDSGWIAVFIAESRVCSFCPTRPVIFC